MSLYQRWSGGPRVNEVEPILVIFEDRKEKEQVLNVMGVAGGRWCLQSIESLLAITVLVLYFSGRKPKCCNEIS